MTGAPSAERHPPRDAVPGVDETYVLTLFVNGATELSARAIAAATDLCETHLAGRHRLSVVDIHDAPVETGLLAVPTLVKDLPLPVRRVVGDLSNIADVLSALEIRGAPMAKRTSG
jgi:circadian clock protein KaiB